jgi:hypothetical protein
MSTVEIFDYEFKAVTASVELPRKKPDLPKGFAKRGAKVTPARSYAHSAGRINTDNRSSSPVRRNRIRSPSPKSRRRTTSVNKWNAALAKLRAVKGFEKAGKGNGAVTAHPYPSHHNAVSIIPPADRHRTNVAIFRAPVRGRTAAYA